MVHGGPAVAAAKTVTDSTLVMGPWGSGAPFNGQFQHAGGSPDWNGWTSVDYTQLTEVRWHADTFGALAGSWSAWCGDLLPSCDGDDPEGGYGNSWNEILEWRGTVADPGSPCTVTIAALLQADTEPGYDFAHVSVVKGGVTLDLLTLDGTHAAAPVNLPTVYSPSDYEGPGGDEVVVRFRFESDSAWSDQDCEWPTDGALRLDDLAITLSNGTGYSHDFEDGTLGDLQPVLPPGVGDFAKIWTGLDQPEVCGGVNTTPMVAFIDDGVVVPGTGGTMCISYCYGPGGYIVNNSGGLAGPDKHLHNAIESPVMPWPGPAYGGARLDFDVWQHETLGAGSPGMFFTWGVRSTTSADPADIADAAWRNRYLLFYGNPNWKRHVEVVSDLIPADARWVQIQLVVHEIGFQWGFVGANGTPAPYFDNVRLTAYPQHGPAMACRVIDLPHDTFPAGGTLDLADLGANSIRFDSGNDINRYQWNGALGNDPGDSVLVTIHAPARRRGPGGDAALALEPQAQSAVRRLPHLRAAGPGLDRGLARAPRRRQPGARPLRLRPARHGLPVPGRLPLLLLLGHRRGGRHPADGPAAGGHHRVQQLRRPHGLAAHLQAARPAHADGGRRPARHLLTQPSILFWDDAGAVGNRDEWYTAFANLGLLAGVDYDIYYTNAPASGTGHGLGGRSTANQLAGYTEVIYTSGVQTAFTIGDGTTSNGDLSRDAQVLTRLAGAGRQGHVPDRRRPGRRHHPHRRQRKPRVPARLDGRGPGRRERAGPDRPADLPLDPGGGAFAGLHLGGAVAGRVGLRAGQRRLLRRWQHPCHRRPALRRRGAADRRGAPGRIHRPQRCPGPVPVQCGDTARTQRISTRA